MDTDTLLQAIKTSIKATTQLRKSSAKSASQKVTNTLLNGLGNLIDSGIQAKYGNKTLWASPGSSARAQMNREKRVASTNDTTLNTEQSNKQPATTNVATQPATTQNTDEKSTDEIIEYTYRPGDTFGQVLLNLGLSDGTNLWGENGDVAYYTEQLRDQGISGNVPVGTKIRLSKRK